MRAVSLALAVAVIEMIGDVAIVKPCVVCGADTDWCCADCGIDSGGENIPHVCPTSACRDAHELAAHKAKADT